jgi:predicted alpha/beta hydrolase
MRIEHVTLRDFGNALLIGTYFTGESTSPRGMILIGCAMGITQKYYRNLAEYLAENGYEVLTLDFRGTGSSAPAKLRNYNVDLMDWANDLGTADLSGVFYRLLERRQIRPVEKSLSAISGDAVFNFSMGIYQCEIFRPGRELS